MFENWQKMVKENQKTKTKNGCKTEKLSNKNQKSTNLNNTSTNDGTKFDSVFIDDFWKSGDSDRQQSSGCVFREDI